MNNLNNRVEDNHIFLDTLAFRAYGIFIAIFSVLYVGVYLPHYFLEADQILALKTDFAVHLLLPMVFATLLFLFRRSVFTGMLIELKWSWAGMLFSILLGIASAYILAISLSTTWNLTHVSSNGQLSLSQIVIIRFDALGVFYLAITAGLFEEWLFKTVLIRCFKKEPRQFVFVATSTVLFAIAHYWQGTAAMINITFLYGLPTAIYYYHKRNVLNLIVIHIVTDVLIFGWAWRAMFDIH